VLPPVDFESTAYTNFATPAEQLFLSQPRLEHDSFARKPDLPVPRPATAGIASHLALYLGDLPDHCCAAPELLSAWSASGTPRRIVSEP